MSWTVNTTSTSGQLYITGANSYTGSYPPQKIKLSIPEPALRQPSSIEPLTEVAALRRRVDEMCAAGRHALGSAL